jgi:hypothetical protein
MPSNKTHVYLEKTNDLILIKKIKFCNFLEDGGHSNEKN